ncbi:methyltransferase domain-containing protein [Candidatus Curtissbacteria bacterium]|nr:methyltransferase domain-containing protein [Candidatus Curtissbacteria bacterium]
MKKNAYTEMFDNEIDHGWYVGTRKLAAKTVENLISKKVKILDLGCGTGGTMKYFIKRGYRNIYGIDNSKYAISFCKKRGIKNVRLGDVNKIPFEDKSFDAIICLDVLYHKGVDLEKAPKEIFRVLKEGGFLYSQEPAYDWLKSKHDEAIETGKRFTKSEISNIFKKNNFIKIKTSYFNTLLAIPIFVSRIKDNITKSDTEKSDVRKMSNIANNLIYLSLTIETYFLKLFSLPFGISIISVWKK